MRTTNLTDREHTILLAALYTLHARIWWSDGNEPIPTADEVQSLLTRVSEW